MTARRSTAKKAPPASAPANPSVPLLTGTLSMAGVELRHPPIGLGLWSLGRWTREDESRTRSTVEHALEAGVQWIDTAEVYGAGRSERILGDVLARRPDAGRSAFVTTKVSWEHLRAPMVRAALLGSLQRLGLASVPVYLVHAPDPHVPLAETLGALAVLHREGRIGAVGVSNFGLDELVKARAILGEVPLVVNQVRYNLLEPDEGEALLEYCRAEKIVVEAYTPLCRGLLAGRYLDGEAPSPEVRKVTRDLFDRDRFPELRDRCLKLRALAEREGVPMAALAFHWLAARGAAPVFGASKPEQVDEAVRAWGAAPGASVLERAEAIARGHAD